MEVHSQRRETNHFGVEVNKKANRANPMMVPFLHFEQAGLDVDIYDFYILEGWLIGPGPEALCPPSTHGSR